MGQAAEQPPLPLQQQQQQLSAYELQRLDRIARNQAVMHSMGLGGQGIASKPEAAAPAAKRLPRKRPPPAAADGTAPALVRRSSWQKCAVGERGDSGEVAAAAGTARVAAQEPEPEPQLVFDDSSVRRYVCEVLSGAADSDSGGDGGDVPDGAAIRGFRQLPGCLHDAALARAYSVDWRPGLVVVSGRGQGPRLQHRTGQREVPPAAAALAASHPCAPSCPQAGGKDGVVSVWGSRQLEAGQVAPDERVPPLLSHKLHKGWVADVQLVGSSLPAAGDPASSGSSSGGDALLLLTAGNDGAVCLWDLGRAAQTGGGARGGGLVPQCLARSTDLHSGEPGTAGAAGAHLYMT